MWVTEFSWDSNPPDPHGVPIGERTRWVQEAFYVLWREGVSAIAWYLLADQPPIPNYGSTYQSGLYYDSGAPKPGLQGFRFPFVVEPVRGGRKVLWGFAPQRGMVEVQALRAKGWQTLFRFREQAPRGLHAHDVNSRAHLAPRTRRWREQPPVAGRLNEAVRVCPRIAYLVAEMRRAITGIACCGRGAVLPRCGLRRQVRPARQFRRRISTQRRFPEPDVVIPPRARAAVADTAATCRLGVSRQLAAQGGVGRAVQQARERKWDRGWRPYGRP